MIELRELSRRFGGFVAVDRVTFRAERGEVVGFLGPNGAGKSTTMKMVAGFLRPTSGTALVDGHDVQMEPLAVKSILGYLPEGAPAYPDMTPLSFLRFIAEVRGFRGRSRTVRVNEVAERVELAGVMRQPIETLSKGYKRRVGLAQALLHDPPVLILDEPTDGLDPNQKHEVRHLIRSLGSEKLIILSTHILEEVEAVCSRAIIIASGKVVADSTPEAMKARSRMHNVVRLCVRSGADGVIDQLRAMSVVDRVERTPAEPGENQPMAGLRIYPRDGRNIVADVSNSLRERGVEIDELRVEQGRLDEVFRTLTIRAEAAS